MYPSKGINPYGQQSYNAQQAYGQMPRTVYSTSSVAGPNVGSQHTLASRQSSMLNATQEADTSGYRTQPSQATQYGGPYASVYGSSSMGSAQQAVGLSAKPEDSSKLQVQGRAGYASAVAESSKFSSGALGSSLGMSSDGYVSASNVGYGQKGDYLSVKGSDYASMDRRPYGDHQNVYVGRDLQNEQARRYNDSVALGHQHKSEMLDHVDQASLLRQQQSLQAQGLKSASDMRQADYLSASAAPTRHGVQEFSSYGGRMDVDPRNLSILGSTPYGGQHPVSILGSASRRNVDDLIYAQGSSSIGYGVGLPPGRDYGAGKGLHSASLEADYQGSVFLHGHPSHGAAIVDERKDDRHVSHRDFDVREERHRDLMREREREREREERERERVRERERDRLLERRAKERERDRKRGPDSRRERTPPRASGDRRATSSVKEERSSRRVSPRRETLHRHRSPVKEKRREYICKVNPFRLVDVERDYMSLHKRYPKLSIAPDFSKVVLNWPKGSLNLSLFTPVSFEHDFVEADPKVEKQGSDVQLDELSKSKCGSTIWNAKVILMSGVSSDALEELCSEKNAADRVVHLNNVLKFAVLKKDRSFMAIGGPWNVAIDGGDPSVDDTSLIQTALRYVKDITQLNLQNCPRWNRFLEIHYNRVGKDGLFSHKEITVLFVPDLLECLPSVDQWRNEWLAHKKNKADKEKQLSSKHDKKSNQEQTVQVSQGHRKMETDFISELKVKVDNLVKEEKDVKMDQPGAIPEKKTEIENAAGQKGKESLSDEKPSVEKGVGLLPVEVKNEEKKVLDGATVDPFVEVQTPTRKKIIKKIVKGKTVLKKELVEDAKHDEKAIEDDVGDKRETIVPEKGTSSDPGKVKTFVRKKVIRKVTVQKSSQMEDEVTNVSPMQTEDTEKEIAVKDAKPVAKDESDGIAVMPESVVKTTGRKKIIKRVIRKKITKKGEKDVNATNNHDVENNQNISINQTNTGDDQKGEDDKKDEELATSSISGKKKAEASKALAVEKENASESKIKKDDQQDETPDAENSKPGKGSLKNSMDSKVGDPKHNSNDSKKDDEDGKKEKPKDGEKKSKDDNQESKDSKSKASKEAKAKRKPEEPSKHPGLFLQTKQSNASKLRSISLSLDGLLDYTEKDIQESTFELSLFAESLNEMFQYQMGCQILSFLEKVRRRFVLKSNQKKRPRDKKSDEGSEKGNSSVKRPKIIDGTPVGNEVVKSEAQDNSSLNQDEKTHEDNTMTASMAASNDSKLQSVTNDNDIEDEEDMEEVFEDEEVDDATPLDEVVQEDGKIDQKDNADPKIGDAAIRDDKTSDEKVGDKPAKTTEKPDKENREGTLVEMDKELLQAFRFFDRNQAGYIKVEDLRCIIHNLGKFLSHRDVKELAQSALLESNSAKDNRVFYKKLLRISDL